MRRVVLCLAVSLVLCALGTTAAQAAAPVITHVNILRARSIHPDHGNESYDESVEVSFSDGVGSESASSLTIMDPSGGAHSPPVWGDPGGPRLARWTEEDRLTPPTPGSYVVTITNEAGEAASLVTPAVPELTDPPAIASPELWATTTETIPTFVWSGGPLDASFDLAVWQDNVSSRFMWGYDAGSQTSAVYDVDGTAAEPELPPGHLYVWRVQATTFDDCATTDPRVNVTTVLKNHGFFTVCSPGPHISHVWIDRGIDVPPAGQSPVYRERMEGAYITDGDGAECLTSVTLTDTDGVTHTITPASGGSTDWVLLDPFTVYVFWADYNLPEPPVPGVYTVTAMDRMGVTDTVVTPYAPLVSSLYPQLIYPDPNYSVLYETMPVLQWTEGVPGADNGINIWESGTDDSIWSYRAGDDTSVPYDVDGTATEPELIPGHCYVWQIHAWSLDDASDPRVTIRTLQHSYGVFNVHSPTPYVEHVWVERGRVRDETDQERFSEHVGAAVINTDEGEEITVTTLTPSGEVHPTADDCACTYSDRPHQIHPWWSNDHETTAPPAGVYTVRAQDAAGNVGTLLTAPAPEVPAALEIMYPGSGSVIAETAPTFAWDALPAGATRACLCLEETGHNTPRPWVRTDLPLSSTSLLYNDNGAARDPQLSPGSQYRLHLRVWFGDTDPSHNADVTSYSERIVEFWVAPKPAPVSIEGTMMVSRCCPSWMVYFLSGDSAHVTPAAASIGTRGDLSRDGQRIAYVGADGVHTCNLDGSSDQLLLEGGCGTPFWSPDGRRIAFTAPTADDPLTPGCGGGGEVFVINADGSGLVRLTYSAYPDRVYGWSPDGRFVLWVHREPSAWTVWVARADGTEAHAIAGAGLPVAADSPLWSPDGQRIALSYSAVGPAGEQLCVLGTIAPDGSDPQPILQRQTCLGGVAPPWWWTFYPWAWSPDGSRLAFTSGMQVIPDGGAGMDFEIYLVNLDGTDLVRLTRDFDGAAVSWRGPNTLPGANATQTICDTTITFTNVAAPGVTTAVVAETPPGPEPSGFQFIGEYYDLRTTAQISGPVTVQIHYEDSEVPGGQEEWLSLLHWEDNHWADVTVRPIDTVNNVITGEVTSLSPFAVVVQLDTTAPVLTAPPDMSVTTTDPNGASVDIGVATATDDRDPSPVITNDAPAVFPVGTTIVTWSAADAAGNTATATQTVTVTLQRYANLTWVAPMANADKRLFKRGSTIPVKFTITDMEGSPATSATATLAIRYLHDGAPEGEPLTVSTANGDEGDTFRHTGDGQYVFNLSTKPPEWYPYYTFLAEVTLDDGQVFSQAFSLK
jgi:hypothetical protein